MFIGIPRSLSANSLCNTRRSSLCLSVMSATGIFGISLYLFSKPLTVPPWRSISLSSIAHFTFANSCIWFRASSFISLVLLTEIAASEASISISNQAFTTSKCSLVWRSVWLFHSFVAFVKLRTSRASWASKPFSCATSFPSPCSFFLSALRSCLYFSVFWIVWIFSRPRCFWDSSADGKS